jgi:DNA-binding MarR family transcriptional regulator
LTFITNNFKQSKGVLKESSALELSYELFIFMIKILYYKDKMTANDILEIRMLSQKYAYHSIEMHSTIAKKAGFANTDHKYLGFFLKKGKLTPGELAELTGLSSGSVTALIDRFERKNLVRREHDSVDRRKVFIVPESEKIRRLMKPFYQDFQDETERLIASFSSEEREVIKTYLTKSLQLTNNIIIKL